MEALGGSLGDPSYFLAPSDKGWLVAFGMDAEFALETDTTEYLNDLIAIGSLPVGGLDYPDRQAIISARLEFLSFLGIDETTLETSQDTDKNPAIVPLDTFIATQRIMFLSGLDSPKIARSTKSALYYAPESVQEKIDNLNKIGLDAAKVINVWPAALNCAPETVRKKVANLVELGIDAVKVINALPSAIGYAPESVQQKIDNLTVLGLNVPKVINDYPPTIGYAPETIQAKVRFISQSVNLLQWQHSAQELVNEFPMVLGFSKQKLAILRRMAAEHLTVSDRSAPVGTVRSALIIPLEKYIIELARQTTASSQSLPEMKKRAKRHDLNASERRAQALAVASTGQLGKVGAMYIRYRKRQGVPSEKS